ncbi:MAG: SDR family oxidoreductase [Candidatus Omnitrophica bacterium]|nr:SDR family oxidoreductase [Candidatus Omnitrophota bacterium]
MRFENKNVLITGASSGIGFASAVLMAKEGANVAFTYCRNEDGAKNLQAELEKLGRKSIGIKTDMTQDEEVVGLAEKTIGEFGRVDALINNAGGLVERMPFFEINRRKWDEILNLNVWSLVLLSQKIGENMKAHGGGVIVNNASVAGRFGGGVGACAYAVAKGAVITLTKSMGRELIPDGIRVNSLAPGIIDTPFHEQFTPPDVMQGLMKNVPIGRAGTAEEMAQIIAFLASDESSYLTGATIDANGGMWVV